MPYKTTTTPNVVDDAILWQSPDSQVRIRRRVKTAGRWPQHDAPIITLDVLPKFGTRVRPIAEGRIDICLEHAAQAALVRAMNEADPKVPYTAPETVPSKPPARKAWWDRRNAQRWEEKRRRKQARS